MLKMVRDLPQQTSALASLPRPIAWDRSSPLCTCRSPKSKMSPSRTQNRLTWPSLVTWFHHQLRRTNQTIRTLSDLRLCLDWTWPAPGCRDWPSYPCRRSSLLVPYRSGKCLGELAIESLSASPDCWYPPSRESCGGTPPPPEGRASTEPAPAVAGSTQRRLRSWEVFEHNHTTCDSLPDTWEGHTLPAGVLLSTPGCGSWDEDISEPGLLWRDHLERSRQRGIHLNWILLDLIVFEQQPFKFGSALIFWQAISIWELIFRKNPFSVSWTTLSPIIKLWTYTPGIFFSKYLETEPMLQESIVTMLFDLMVECHLKGLQQLSPIPCHITMGTGSWAVVPVTKARRRERDLIVRRLLE